MNDHSCCSTSPTPFGGVSVLHLALLIVLVSVIHESFSSWTLSLLTFKIIPPHPGLLQEALNNLTAFTRSTSPAQLGQCRWIHWLKINSSILLFRLKVIRGFCLINKTELGIENAPRSISSLPFKHNFLLLLCFMILSFKANYPPPPLFCVSLVFSCVYLLVGFSFVFHHYFLL